MNTYRSAQGLFAFCSVALAAMIACSEDERVATGADPVEQNVDAAAAPRERPEPRSVIDLGPTEGQYCAVVIDARCDGDEDCPDAQVCCGTLSGAGFHYEALGCAETCDGASGGYRICHQNELCEDEALVCRRSSILPAYFAICAAASDLVPTTFEGTSTAAGEVRCGAELVCGSGQKCCVLTGFDAASGARFDRPGYCAPADAECSCRSATALDAGS